MKVLSNPTPYEIELFRAEAQISAQLQHPGIPPIHSSGKLTSGNPFFTMREIKGRTFKDIMYSVHRVSRGGPWRETDDGWSFRRLVSVFKSVCDTVAYAHSKGVVHRDLKPSNIMIGAFGEVLVVDWGIATMVHPSRRQGLHQPIITTANHHYYDSLEQQSIVGTPAYMSPEQANGQDDALGPSSDIYSLGVILYELLTGRKAFTGDVYRILKQKSNPLFKPSIEDASSPADAPHSREVNADSSSTWALPTELVALCEQAMSYEPTGRPGRALDMAEGFRLG